MTDRYRQTMDAEIVYITLGDEDRGEFDRLVERHGGDHSSFLQEAIKVMADPERAEHCNIDAPEWACDCPGATPGPQAGRPSG